MEFSYARNSKLQRRVLDHVTKPMVEIAIRYLLSDETTHPYKVLNVADFGCGVGPTPVGLISMVIETVNKICKELNSEDDQVPEIQIYMNDLPSNDFNFMFKNLAEVQLSKRDGMPLCFVMGAPGSFFNRLFTHNSLHLVHSNYALHWLSQVPRGIYNEVGISKNKGNIIVSEASPRDVVKAYRAQFEQDLSLFLKCRSCEVVGNGHMILSFMGSLSMAPHQHWTASLLSQAITNLVSKGKIKREKADSFSMPIHYPCKEEIQEAVMKEGSFAIEKIETITDAVAGEIKDIITRAEAIAKGIRAAVEVLVSHHLGNEVWSILYDEFIQLILCHLEAKSADIFSIIFMLRKKMN